MSNKILTKKALIPGQTSMLVLDCERIPLTIADTDKEAGTITIVYLVVGKSSALLETLNEGDTILDVCGPLGKPTHIEKSGTVICVGGGTGIAAMHHIAKGHHLAGNHVVAIVGARSKNMLLFC
ncbi:sulfide/dihydroorotate dehydrogenase-like FAD/NAD-binding protein, partial [Aduncisulcus paluster]